MTRAPAILAASVTAAAMLAAVYAWGDAAWSFFFRPAGV
jgi:hypothetical protein